MNRRAFLATMGGGVAGLAVGGALPRMAAAQPGAGAGAAAGRGPDARPNILVMMSDDQSYRHTSINGSTMVRTPTFDRLAREGANFRHAHCNAPSCSPSRASFLTGQHFWRLEAGSQLWGHLPAKFEVYPDVLMAAGYKVGSMGKGYGPTKRELSERPGGHPPAGPIIPDYDLAGFLDSREPGQPFCVFYGSSDPHRGYKPELKQERGIDPADMAVPAFLPDVPEVRADLADYAAEVERFDETCGKWVSILEERGLLDNTIVIMTSDNGMPFPRAKMNLYDVGTRMPMAVRWPGRIAPGTVVDEYVSFVDVAPTLLEAAGAQPMPDMTGRSFLGLVTGAGGASDAGRDFVVTGVERHGWIRPDGQGYPMRAIRNDRFAYIRNYEPDRYPGPHPSIQDDWNDATDAYLIRHKDDDPTVGRMYDLAFGQRPAEELYDLTLDPEELDNVADVERYAAVKQQMAAQLDRFLSETQDPRHLGRGDMFDQVPYHGNRKYFVPAGG